MEEIGEEVYLTKKERRELKRQLKKEAKEKEKRVLLIKRIGTWLAVGLGVAILVFAIIKENVNKPNLPTPIVDAVSAADQAKGNKEAKVVLIEYSDFQCPACGQLYPNVKKLSEEYQGQTLVVYRHFPLSQVHKHAELAAYAAEAAGKQGKFWEMHDKIFEGQADWSTGGARDTFISYARDLELDIEKFESGMDSDEVKEKVKNDYKSGIKAGVDATPTLFLNGSQLVNAASYDKLKAFIEDALVED